MTATESITDVIDIGIIASADPPKQGNRSQSECDLDYIEGD